MSEPKGQETSRYKRHQHHQQDPHSSCSVTAHRHGRASNTTLIPPYNYGHRLYIRSLLASLRQNAPDRKKSVLMSTVERVCEGLAEAIHSKERDRSKILTLLRRLTRVRGRNLPQSFLGTASAPSAPLQSFGIASG